MFTRLHLEPKVVSEIGGTWASGCIVQACLVPQEKLSERGWCLTLASLPLVLRLV